MKGRALSAPDVTGEAARAAIYVGLGGLALKATQLVLRAFGSKRETRLSEIDRVLAAQETFNASLLRDNSAMRAREDELEAKLRREENRINQLQEEVRKAGTIIDECQTECRRLMEENADLRAEVRAWKRGMRSPPPETP